MWQQSENARLEQELAQYGSDALFRKFRTASREAVRLAAALRGFIADDTASEEEKSAYRDYLTRRPIPAAIALIEENRMGDLEKLWAILPISDSTLETLLKSSRKLRRQEAIVFLLREKAERGTFRDRDFSL